MNKIRLMIGIQAFPDGGWPEDIHHLPEILESFALSYGSKGEFKQSLRLCLELCFVISH